MPVNGMPVEDIETFSYPLIISCLVFGNDTDVSVLGLNPARSFSLFEAGTSPTCKSKALLGRSG